ncbi:hypothetical protein A2154_04660 [Candidatus Gottesmanbacteria bacterium RBG_16_43_7]|uniref:SGNH hydrolase-type esterase domain-containing protein n=1 Tax=Candidatus Gottesmanbacteria bacterium RBG_16_43_7 TaxID=1798373 RepID=A0A1F5Z9U6_9BACT|nr:MAG: hypothetical protein A2154_04660 [Candidatus Gottesmanbacteria bacterium RBG_16_43_7]
MDIILSLLALSVYAAEIIISPLPDQRPATVIQEIQQAPDKSFGTLLTFDPAAVEKSASGSGGTASESAVISESPQKPAKSQYTVALLGDSMVDTLGADFTELQTVLQSAYPAVKFTLLNYGVGATNIEYGLFRITNAYTYLDRQFPSLLSQNPDIVVVESFGYNPFPYDIGAMDQHWLYIARIIDTLRQNLPEVKIILLATIAPNSDVFADGVPDIHFDAQGKREHAIVVNRYLGNIVNFARSQNLPLADAYHDSLDGSGQGKLEFINAGDHIHYSPAGRTLVAQKIFNAINNNKLLE